MTGHYARLSPGAQPGWVAVGCLLALMLTSTVVAAQTTEELTLEGEGYLLPATLALPAEGAQPHPCVVFFAGSGPTDRNWLSPLIQGANGSAQQIAEALAQRGIGSIRFDKVGSGQNMEPLEILSLEHYVDEATLAYRHLSALDACGSIFLLGNSEGAWHVMRTGVALQSEPDFGGVISMSGPSRQILEHAIEQLHQQLATSGADMSRVEPELDNFRQAMLGLPETALSPPDFTVIPQAMSLWAPAVDEAQGRVVRELMTGDPLESVRAYQGPALIMSANNDIQVPIDDGDAIFDALPEAGQLRQRVVIESANHVYKYETRSLDDTPAGQLALGYADPDHELAPGVVDSIAAFVQVASHHER